MQATESLQTDWARTSIGWQERNLKIVNKAAKVVPLQHNRAQLMLMNAKQRQRKLGCPIRIIIVKARQKGLSTGEAAATFEDINRNSNSHACLVSMDIDGTDKVFRMSKTFQRLVPEDVRRQTDKSNRKEIVYSPPHNSSILCQTAGKDVLGRGGTTKRGHYTEVAFWANAERQIAALLQEVPKTPESSVVIESTAFGTVGAFHSRYLSAVDRVRSKDFTGFIPLFVPWFVDDEYSMDVPKGMDITLESDHENYGDEQALFRKFGLSVEQLYWRRWMIQNDFDNDLTWFMQEYPSTWREAFQGSGRMVFRPSDVDEMEKRCCPAIATVEFYEEDGKVKYRHVNRRSNCWSVWRWPERSHSYVAFGDVAEGILSDQNNPKSDPDRSVAGIEDRNRKDLPAVYYGRPDTIEFADQFILGCKYYNYPWASPEMNSIGQSVLDAFKRAEYPYIYAREHKEEEVQREDSKKYGWKTTVLTRKPMIADLQEVVKTGALIIYDIRIIGEMRVFVWNKQGKAEAETGEHDDCVVMVAGIVQLDQRCPWNEDLSLADEPAPKPGDYAIAGQVDADDDLDDDEDDLMYSEEDFD
jgi:hypothetical protein